MANCPRSPHLPFSFQSRDPFTGGLGRDGQRLRGSTGVVLAAPWADHMLQRWCFFSISHVDFCGFMWLHVDVYLVCCSCGLMWMDVVSVFCIYFSSPRSCPCKSADFTKLILPQENLLRLAAKHPLRLWKWGGWGFEGPTMRYRNKYWALDLGLSTERDIYIYM